MAQNTLGTPASYPIESVGNALRLISAFKGRSSIGVSEASRELGVARSTAHRLLAMLQQFGFVAQDGVTRTYHAGPELIEIGAAVGIGDDLKNAGHRYLESLVATFEAELSSNALDSRPCAAPES